MSITADVYKGPIKLGSGSINSGSNSLTGFTLTDANYAVHTGRRVIVHSRAGSSAKDGHHPTIVNGETWQTRVTTDGGATLTLADNCPH